MAATATPIAAKTAPRGGPSARSCCSGLATGATLWPVGDGAREGAGDAGDLLDVWNDVELQVVERRGADPDDDVVRSGHVLRRQHPWQRRQLLRDDFGAANLGLNQHERLDHHPRPPPFPLHRLLAAGTKRTAGRAVLQGRKETRLEV